MSHAQYCHTHSQDILGLLGYREYPGMSLVRVTTVSWILELALGQVLGYSRAMLVARAGVILEFGTGVSLECQDVLGKGVAIKDIPHF